MIRRLLVGFVDTKKNADHYQPNASVVEACCFSILLFSFTGNILVTNRKPLTLSSGLLFFAGQRFCQLLWTAEVWERAERSVWPRGAGVTQGRHGESCRWLLRTSNRCYYPSDWFLSDRLHSAVMWRVLLCVRQVGAVRLFFTPEEGDEPQSHAKRHFLQTGEGNDNTEWFRFVFPLLLSSQRLRSSVSNILCVKIMIFCSVENSYCSKFRTVFMSWFFDIR